MCYDVFWRFLSNVDRNHRIPAKLPAGVKQTPRHAAFALRTSRLEVPIQGVQRSPLRLVLIGSVDKAVTLIVVNPWWWQWEIIQMKAPQRVIM